MTPLPPDAPATPPPHCLGSVECCCRWHLYRLLAIHAPHVLSEKAA